MKHDHPFDPIPTNHRQPSQWNGYAGMKKVPIIYYNPKSTLAVGMLVQGRMVTFTIVHVRSSMGVAPCIAKDLTVLLTINQGVTAVRNRIRPAYQWGSPRIYDSYNKCDPGTEDEMVDISTTLIAFCVARYRKVVR